MSRESPVGMEPYVGPSVRRRIGSIGKCVRGRRQTETRSTPYMQGQLGRSRARPGILGTVEAERKVAEGVESRVKLILLIPGRGRLVLARCQCPPCPKVAAHASSSSEKKIVFKASGSCMMMRVHVATYAVFPQTNRVKLWQHLVFNDRYAVCRAQPLGLLGG